MLLPGLVNDISTPGNHFRLVSYIQVFTMSSSLSLSLQMLGYGLINSILKQSKEQVSYLHLLLKIDCIPNIYSVSIKAYAVSIFRF